MLRGLSSFRPTEVVLTHERRVIFLECVKTTSVGLKLDRPQLQHWLLLLEHSRSENSNAAAGLLVPMSYDCVYGSACDSSRPFDFE